MKNFLDITIENGIQIDQEKPGVIVWSHPTIFDGIILRNLLKNMGVKGVTYMVRRDFHSVLSVISYARRERNSFISLDTASSKTQKRSEYNECAIGKAVDVLLRRHLLSIFAIWWSRYNGFEYGDMKPGFSRIAKRYFEQDPAANLKIYPVRFIHSGLKLLKLLPRGNISVNFSQPLNMTSENFSEIQQTVQHFLTSHP